MRVEISNPVNQITFLLKAAALFLRHPLQSLTLWTRCQIGNETFAVLYPLRLTGDALHFLSAMMKKDSEDIFFRGEILLCQIEDARSKLATRAEILRLLPWTLFTFQVMIEHGMRSMEIERSASLMVRCYNETGVSSLEGIPAFDARLAQMFLSAFRAKRMLSDQAPLSSSPLKQKTILPVMTKKGPQNQKVSSNNPYKQISRIPSLTDTKKKNGFADVIPFPFRN